MMNRRFNRAASFAGAIFCAMLVLGKSSHAQPPADRAIDPDKARVIEHWNEERRRAAQPRDPVIDPAGRGYLRRRDGSLVPYGEQLTAESTGGAAPRARPSGSNDTTPPSISNLDPGLGAVIGGSYTFAATVTDESGLRSVSFVIRYPNGATTQTFTPSYDGEGRWSVTLSGFFDGDWTWWVEAKDAATKGGNTNSSDPVYFSVSTGGVDGGGQPGSGTVTNSVWTSGGTVQIAAGRLYFEMPNNAQRRGRWAGYVCSGSVVVDDINDRSVILTAAHCVYDDANKSFARNVLFIPDQAGTTASGTDLNCFNDPLGCWVPSFGVVDGNWATRTFPNNIPWDYAHYVVSDSGAHAGAVGSSESLESAAGALQIDFSTPLVNDGSPGAGSVDFTHALGYSYSEDPKLMYCAEDMTTEGGHNWWLPSCGLSGGSSGGPWMQPVKSGNGSVISVNSWGYTDSPGMAGPKLSGTSAECVLQFAKYVAWSQVETTDGDAGWIADCR